MPCRCGRRVHLHIALRLAGLECCNDCQSAAVSRLCEPSNVPVVHAWSTIRIDDQMVRRGESLAPYQQGTRAVHESRQMSRVVHSLHILARPCPSTHRRRAVQQERDGAVYPCEAYMQPVPMLCIERGAEKWRVPSHTPHGPLQSRGRCCAHVPATRLAHVRGGIWCGSHRYRAHPLEPALRGQRALVCRAQSGRALRLGRPSERQRLYACGRRGAAVSAPSHFQRRSLRHRPQRQQVP